jgi:hypothetical protein
MKWVKEIVEKGKKWKRKANGRDEEIMECECFVVKERKKIISLKEKLKDHMSVG